MGILTWAAVTFVASIPVLMLLEYIDRRFGGKR